MESMRYYVFRGKEIDMVVFFLAVRRGTVEFPDEMWNFLSSVYSVKNITQAEAETYEEFDVAPIVDPTDLGVILLGGGMVPRREIESCGFLESVIGK